MEAPGTVLSWDAPSTKQPADATASYHNEQKHHAIALANIVIMVANESADIMPY